MAVMTGGRRRLWRPGIALAVLLAGAACGNDTRSTDQLKAVAGQVFRTGAPEARPPTPLPSRAVLDQQAGSYLLARIPATGGDALMIAAGRNGPVRTWTTGEGTTIALRDGVLVGTRGLRGADLMSAQVPPLSALQRGEGGLRRVTFTLDGDDQTVRREYLCELRNAGAETVTLIERTYPVRHIVESCTGAAGAFENHYWIDASGSLRRSRQWIGPELGSVELDLLKD